MRLLFVLITITSFSCIDHKSLPVDSWSIFKHPTEFGYHLFVNDSIIEFSDSIVSFTSPLIRTLNTTHSNYILYNDQPPNGWTTAIKAHSKGIIVFNEHRGFWIIHSIPKFPDFKSNNIFLQDYTFGQSIVCISFRTPLLEIISTANLVNNPNVYDFSISNNIQQRFPTLYRWIINGERSKETYQTQLFQTLGGMDLFIFSKSRKWNQDLFESLIAPYFNYDFIVASWQNGASANVMPSYCRPNHTHQIENVRKLCMNSLKDDCWVHTRDHSKWAISNQNFIVCVGDINRQYSQEKRGGGTLCMRNKNLWSFLRQSIIEYEKCDSLEN